MKIKSFFFLNLLLISWYNYIACEMDILTMIKKYYETQHIKNIVIMSCYTKYHKKIIYEFSRNGFRTAILNIDKNPITEKSLITNKYDLGIVLNMSCLYSFNLLNNISSYFTPSIFSEKYYWILIDNKLTNYTKIFLSNLNFNVDINLLYVTNHNQELYKIYDVYNTGKNYNGKLVINELGYWGETNINFTSPLKVYKYTRRSNMSEVVLKSMIVITIKIKTGFKKYISTPFDTHFDPINRNNFALLQLLRDMYKFDYHMRRTNTWGYIHNGTFDGMMGQFERKNIDIGGSPIIVKLERIKFVDFTVQTWIAKSHFMFRHPKRTSSILKIYARPFEYHVWYCILGIVILAMCVIHLLNKIQYEMSKKHQESSISIAIIFILGVLFQQGSQNKLNIISGKIITLTINIFSIITYQFFSASIVASLLLKPPITIRSLKDLLNSDLRVGMEEIAYSLDYFAKSNDSVVAALYKKIVQSHQNNILNPVDGLTLVKQGGYAFHVDISTGYKIIRDTFLPIEICELNEIQVFTPQKMVTVLQKNSPFKEMVTYGLRKIAEVGLMNKQYSIWQENKPKCIHKIESSDLEVTITDFSSPIIFLLCGMILSIIILLTEIKMGK